MDNEDTFSNYSEVMRWCSDCETVTNQSRVVENGMAVYKCTSILLNPLRICKHVHEEPVMVKAGKHIREA